MAEVTFWCQETKIKLHKLAVMNIESEDLEQFGYQLALLDYSLTVPYQSYVSYKFQFCINQFFLKSLQINQAFGYWNIRSFVSFWYGDGGNENVLGGNKIFVQVM